MDCVASILSCHWPFSISIHCPDRWVHRIRWTVTANRTFPMVATEMGWPVLRTRMLRLSSGSRPLVVSVIRKKKKSPCQCVSRKVVLARDLLKFIIGRSLEMLLSATRLNSFHFRSALSYVRMSITNIYLPISTKQFYLSYSPGITAK